MDKILDNYLEKINQYLKPMPVSERADIIKEIKSEMIELEANNRLSPKEIIERLGEPKELAKAYLGDAISKDHSFRWKKVPLIIAFYSFAGLTGIFVLPMISVFVIGLVISGVIAPIAGIIKFVGFLIGLDVPFVMFQIGSFTAHPLLVLPLSMIIGLCFVLGGIALWKILVKYIQVVSFTKRRLL